MFWNVLECFGMFWGDLECFWNVLGVLWGVLECFTEYFLSEFGVFLEFFG
jgi:hypothetical protein